MKADTQTFEEALAQLEQIVSKLEGGELSLDESLAAFEDGVRLSKVCHDRLDQAEQKVEVLLSSGARREFRTGEATDATPE